jgi:probable F420-dependent oxidoreductase
MRLGLTFGQLNPKAWQEVAVAADQLGYESLWLPEHLVFPLEVSGQLIPGEEHPPVPPTVPIYEPCAYLSFLAARTTRIRLGTFVYLLGIRHPFISARGFATLDLLSGGRALCGVGAGWLTTEWRAAGLDPATRGARLDEAIGVVRRLWTEPEISHDGEFFPFQPVAFEPKPAQAGGPPILVGGESPRALRRAATVGDGWLGMWHTPASAAERAATLRGLAEAAGRDPASIEVTVMGSVDDDQPLDAWAEAGVDRLIVTPWQRSSEALDAIAAFADRVGLSARA